MALIDGLIAYWTLDEAALDDTRVDSLNGHDLVAVGAGVNVETGLLGNCTRGTLNTANYLETASHDDEFRPTANGMTINCRLKLPVGGDTVNNPILAHWADADRSWMLWGRGAVDSWSMRVSNDGTTSIDADWTAAYSVNVWYMVTGFLDPANDRAGVQVDRGTTAWTALTGPFHGATQPLTHQLFNGSVAVAGSAFCDELGLWNRILTSDELDTLYNSGGAPPAFESFGDLMAGAGFSYYY